MVDRRLAAIMFTDIVGYTSLMGRDEKKAFRLLEKNRDIHKPIILKFHGKFLKEIGDAVLASFKSVSDAVLCAKEIIKSTKNETDLSLRIGVHEGEVVFKNGDVYGDGVNVASRIQELAVPDSILISDRVYDEIKNKSDLQFVHLGAFHLRGDSKIREIYAMSGVELRIPQLNELKLPVQKETSRSTKNKINSESNINPSAKHFYILSPRGGLISIFTILALVFGSLMIVNFHQNTKAKWARQTALPEIQRLIDQEEIRKAYQLAVDAEQYIEDDSLLMRQFRRISGYLSFYSTPSGARLYRKPVGSTDDEYLYIGQTPIESTRIYGGFSVWKLVKEGVDSIEFLSDPRWLHQDTVRLFDPGINPVNMIYVPFDQWNFEPTGWISGVGYGNYPPPQLNNFLIDKYEVTNRDYKKFVDAGGYKDRKYWRYPFIQKGIEIRWAEAINQFKDRTGQTGPSTWEIGSYPEGQADYPVAGVSWYEAMAYAEYVGKSLPTVYHWTYAATPTMSYLISPYGNYNEKECLPVGSCKVPGVYGTFDMAGNVREWCFNRVTDTGERFTLGGGWNDNPYSYNIAFVLDAFDRSMVNGFRCMKNMDTLDFQKLLFESIDLVKRDYINEKPISDQIFDFYLQQFKYDKSPLNSTIKEINSRSDQVICQKITIDAAYDDERLPIYIFVPKNTRPPYQVVIYFPTTWPLDLKNFESGPNDAGVIEHFIKSGRVGIYPIYKGFYERNSGFHLMDLEKNKYKEHVIMWAKDLSRTIDYLETREDVDIEKIGYFGYSLGAANGAILPAIDQRIKLVMLHVGGFWQANIMSEVDQINYLSRISVPVLMLNGRYDHIFPLETSQKPMFDLFGTPPTDKRHYIYESGHKVPWHELTKETLTWMDNYFGPVQTISLVDEK